MDEIRFYRDLIAWQRGMDLVVLGYQVTDNLPGEERFGLTAQVRRALVSVHSNIAEVWARGKTGDYLRFLRTSRGSLAEARTQCELIDRLNMAQVPCVLNELLEETDRVLQGLIRSLERFDN